MSRPSDFPGTDPVASPLLAGRGARLLAWAIIGSGLAWAGDPLIEEKETSLRSVQEEMEQISEKMGTERAQRTELEAQLRQIEGAIAESAKGLRRIREAMDAAMGRIESVERQRAAKASELATARTRLAGQLRSAYALGRQDRIKLMLNQEDPADLNRLLAYHDYLSRTRVEQVALVAEHSRALQALLDTLKADKEQLAGLGAEREREQAELGARQAERKALLEAIDRTLAAQDQRFRALESDAAAMRQLIERLRLEAVTGIGDFKPIARLRGQLPWPAKGPLQARFGAPKQEEGVRWDGVLIGAVEGAEVRAVHLGRVAFAEWLRGFGLLLIIDHGEGFMSLYGHNQTLLKEVGEWVEAGDPVALVGDSGGEAQPGLYFAMRHKGKPLNPSDWCMAEAQPRQRPQRGKDSRG
jgi:septal ring factor EnvC (AmiA/AmiB activator)